MARPTPTLFSSRKDMDRAAADLVLQRSLDAVAERGRFVLALSGGSTPLGLYRLLAEAEYSSRMPWDRTMVLPGDDRLVPLADERSNLGAASRLLLDHVPLPQANILRPDLDAGDSRAVALAFEELLVRRLGEPSPRLDLCLLGMGGDGHTASLFPGRETLGAIDRVVVWEEHPGMEPRVPRVSLSLDVINQSRTVLFLAAGPDKEARVNEVLATAGPASPYPAARVLPEGELLWYVSRE